MSPARNGSRVDVAGHSTATMQIWRCKSSGAWSPCSGGADASNAGDGYCASGYRGPRCELCDGANAGYFDKFDAACHDCGNVVVRIVILCSVLTTMLAAVGSVAVVVRTDRCCARTSRALLRRIRLLRRAWDWAGMRFKVKSTVGFYQCVSAVPTVFNVAAPSGLEHYYTWIRLIELPADVSDAQLDVAHAV